MSRVPLESGRGIAGNSPGDGFAKLPRDEVRREVIRRHYGTGRVSRPVDNVLHRIALYEIATPDKRRESSPS